jgi:hypothetical protein
MLRRLEHAIEPPKKKRKKAAKKKTVQTIM